ncbi:hypothetical protein BST61_g11297 [Cercospora zeina]
MRSGYGPLDGKRREIRILHVLPGIWTVPLNCTLQVVALKECPSYQALSYTWGDETPMKTMLLNSEPCEIRTNLWSALRRLRRSSERRTLWVDAICINQADAQERSSQLALMGPIYPNTAEVLIWLGDSLCVEGSLPCSPGTLEDGKDLTWLIKNIEHVCQETAFHDRHSEALGAFAALYLLSIDEHWCDKAVFETEGKEHCRVAAKHIYAWQALQQLLKLAWWSRIWVLQEAILARKATMILGSTSVPSELIHHFCRSYQKHLPAGACFQMSF